jgi:hypothetical protein
VLHCKQGLCGTFRFHDSNLQNKMSPHRNCGSGRAQQKTMPQTLR